MFLWTHRWVYSLFASLLQGLRIREHVVLILVWVVVKIWDFFSWSNYKKNRSFRIMLGLLQQFGLHWLFELCENPCWDHQLLQLQLATQSGTSPLLHHCCTSSIRWWNTRFAKVTAMVLHQLHQLQWYCTSDCKYNRHGRSTYGRPRVGFHFVAWPLLQDLRLIKSKVVSWSVSWDHWQ